MELVCALLLARHLSETTCHMIMYVWTLLCKRKKKRVKGFWTSPTSRKKKIIMCLWKANDEKFKNLLGTKIIYLLLLPTYYLHTKCSSSTVVPWQSSTFQLLNYYIIFWRFHVQRNYFRNSFIVKVSSRFFSWGKKNYMFFEKKIQSFFEKQYD